MNETLQAIEKTIDVLKEQMKMYENKRDMCARGSASWHEYDEKAYAYANKIDGVQLTICALKIAGIIEE